MSDSLKDVKRRTSQMIQFGLNDFAEQHELLNKSGQIMLEGLPSVPFNKAQTIQVVSLPTGDRWAFDLNWLWSKGAASFPDEPFRFFSMVDHDQLCICLHGEVKLNIEGKESIIPVNGTAFIPRGRSCRFEYRDAVALFKTTPSLESFTEIDFKE